MKKTRRGFIIIVFSTAFLCIYLNIPRILGKIGNRVMNVKVLSMEEIDLMCEGKEDAFMEPEITLGGGKIAYDSGQNLLLIPQKLSTEYFDGTLQVPDGTLYFLEDEGLENKKDLNQ